MDKIEAMEMPTMELNVYAYAAKFPHMDKIVAMEMPTMELNVNMEDNCVQH